MTDAPRATSIAIIGMAARLPGANSIERFWSNLAGGVESITHFSDEELLAAGAEPEWLERPDFVKAAPVLEEIDKFDAPFFKISRREAEMMDPQQRIMLELAWEALERAGYAGPSYGGLIGVVAGAGGLMSSYLLSPLHVRRRLIGATGSMQCIGNDKDYLATRISYKLNLRGPSLTVQTACSTSFGGGPPGLPEPVGGRLRPVPGRRRDGPRAAPHGLSFFQPGPALARRPLPRLRRRRRGDRLR